MLGINIMLRRFILVLPLRSRDVWSADCDWLLPFFSKEAAYKDKEQRDEYQINECGREHPADNRCPNGGLCSRTGPGGDGLTQAVLAEQDLQLQ